MRDFRFLLSFFLFPISYPIEMWLSLVERLVRDQEAVGSSPAISTTKMKDRLRAVFCFGIGRRRDENREAETEETAWIAVYDGFRAQTPDFGKPNGAAEIPASSSSPVISTNKETPFVNQKAFLCLSKPQAWHIITHQSACISSPHVCGVYHHASACISSQAVRNPDCLCILPAA